MGYFAIFVFVTVAKVVAISLFMASACWVVYRFVNTDSAGVETCDTRTPQNP